MEHQILKSHALAPHLWIVFFAVLALAVVILIELSPADPSPVAAGSALAPVLSHPGGYYDQDIWLKASVPDPDARIVFTVDGSVPTVSNGTIYTQAIRLSAATPAVTVIRARAVLPSGEMEPIVSASYFVGMRATLPMMSLIVDPSDLWDSTEGIFANALQRGIAWERPADVTYVGTDHRSGFHIPAGIRVHGGLWNRGFEKKSLRLYFRQEYGASWLEYPLFADTELGSFKRLVLHAGGQDWHAFPHTNWTLMRNQLANRLAFELGGYATYSQPVLLFINGEPWGIYQMRERPDEWFLQDHYGVGAADFLKGPEFPGEQDILMGDRGHWDHLLEFVESHDMADPANYAYVQTQVDVADFIDYNILQIYAANTDWPFQNEYQFRPRVQGGRWHWLFWDSDYGFGHVHYGSVDWDMIDRVLTFNHPETGGRDLLLLRRLLENPAFLDRFLSRTADLLNTTLSPPSVIAHIDALAAELEPDIAHEAVRWSSSVNWQASVQELREFARRRPDLLRQHVVEGFGLTGTSQLTVDPPLAGSGSVAINGSLLHDLPWQGVYFHDVPIQVQAAPAPGFRFAGWNSPDLPQSPAITLTLHDVQAVAPRFEPVADDSPRPGDVVFATYHMDPDSHLEADRFELLVTRPGGVDLRGWRVTDNDAKTATDEGSLIFAHDPALAHVPSGTRIQIIASHAVTDLPTDDVSTWDRRMVLHAGNALLDADSDPGFNLGPHDNLVLLAPGPTGAFADDQGIDFVTESVAVTPASFGVLSDGVLPPPAPVQESHAATPTWALGVAGAAALYFSVRPMSRRND